jgi:hypothetical protein
VRMVGYWERPFVPPPERQLILVPVLYWLGIAFALYKGYGWWIEKDVRRTPAHRIVVQQQEVVPDRPVTPSPPPVARPLSIEPPAPQAAAAPLTQTGGTIYLCRNYEGGTFWASNHCNQHSALIERMVSVPEGISFQHQVQIAEQRRRALESSLAVQTSYAAAPPPSISNKMLCESHDQRVNQLDEMARQPQSGQMQDWIRIERQKTRDEQFRLRC